MTDDRTQKLNPAGVAAIPVVTSSTPPPPPAPPYGASIETPEIAVKVSRELLAELATWSEPVQVMVERVGGEYTMIARRHDCPATVMGA